ncbi:hypothetical protein INT47_009732 [Mucor saturninus]|uniref:Uncharacterized protein n=1 Tax=Mucor saturninus TaxID=64648 RepID=A0A8H7QEW1_9FUNG|nr:hypothetical protein INT47_009732 [Mucor saturninus]
MSEAFYDLFNSSEKTLEGLLSTRSNAFPLSPITSPTLQAYSELIPDSVLPVEKAFDHRPLLLYHIANIATVKNVYNVNQDLMQYGFSTPDETAKRIFKNSEKSCNFKNV